MKILVAIICSLLIFYSFSNAQIDTNNAPRKVLDYEIIKEIEVKQMKIVSASRSAKSMEDIPVTVYVITHDEIIRNGYVTLVDVLKSVPGIKVSQPHSGELGEAFMQRGLIGNDYTKILINNVPIKPSAVTGMPIGAQLPIRQAERIEIIYGPASAVYGTDAAAGVINIITKNPSDGAYAFADVTLGQGQYSYTNFFVGGKAGRNKKVIDFSIYGSKLNFEEMNINHTKDQVYNPLHYLAQEMDSITYYDANSQMQKINTLEMDKNFIFQHQDLFTPDFLFFINRINGSIQDFKLSKIPQASDQIGVEIKFKGFGFQYNHMHRKDHSTIGLSSLLYNYSNPANYQSENIDRFVLTSGFTYRKISLNQSLTYLKYRMDESSTRGVNYLDGYPNLYLYSASDDIFLEENLTYTPKSNLEFVTGLSVQYSGNLPLTNENLFIFNTDNYKPFSTKKIPDDPVFGQFGFNPIVFYSYSTYIQAYWSFWKISLIGGSRYDFNSIYGKSINPRIAAIWKFNHKISMRLSIGQAFKAPSSSDIYNSVAVPNNYDSTNSVISYQLVPNKQLKPEIIASNELGFRYFFSNANFLDIVIYSNTIENLIKSRWLPLDTQIYNGVGANQDFTLTRILINEEEAIASLNGFQFIFVFRNIIKSWNLNLQSGFTFSQGTELIPDENDNLQVTKIKELRQTPDMMIHMSFDFSPNKRMYIRAENTIMSTWTKAYFPPTAATNNANYFKTDGYYNLDLIFNFKISNQFTMNATIKNVFDSEYGGIDARGMDVDLKYNPQLKRNIRFGINYRFK